MTYLRVMRGTAGLIFAAVFLFLQLPGLWNPAKTVKAEEAKTKSISGLGSGSIENPEVPQDSEAPWQGSYVYYGGDKYRVLANNTNTYSQSAAVYTMLLDCDNSVKTRAFNPDPPFSNSWKGSAIQAWLNGEFFNTKFTAAEQAAIAQSYQGNAEAQDSLTGERVFLLTVEDVTNNSYGYYAGEGDFVNSRQKPGTVYGWWLRTPDSNDSFVRAAHGVMVGAFRADVMHICVKPAFNVALSSIIFASLIPDSTNEYKLTLKDSGLTIASNTVSRNSRVINTSNTTGGNPTQISVVMTENGGWDKDEGCWEDSASLKYYIPLSKDGKFALPDDYEDNWHTYLLAEKINPGTETDYAGDPVRITIPESNVQSWSNSADKQTPSEPEVNVHVHNLATARWKITREATPSDDGEISLFCMECGEMLDTQPVSGYYAFLVDTGRKIRNARLNEEVVISTNKWISFNSIVLDELKVRPDIKVIVEYRYDGHMWEVVIPAGTDVDTLKNQEGYAGFEFLAGKFGKHEIKIVQ